MGSIALQVGGSTVHTVSVPQPNFYAVKSARLIITGPKGTVLNASPTSTSSDSIVFNISPSNSQLLDLASLSDCSWKTARYVVVLQQGGTPMDPPSKNIDSGSVTVSGTLPSMDCGGEDPAAPPTPPPGEDSPFGESDGGDLLIPGPEEPPAPCLPPPFNAPAPSVPTPCSSGPGGSGTLAFSNV